MKALLALVALIGFGCTAIADDGTGTALDEVNSIRKANGLTPYVYDAGLEEAAKRCSQARAANFISGHTANDFAYLPAGVSADAAGCAAWHPSMGWGSCCMFDNYTYAGAAFTFGRDGNRYMHLFVRGGDGRRLGQRVPLSPPASTCTGPTCSGGTCPACPAGEPSADCGCGQSGPRFTPFGGRFRRR
jgi:hypothetical protein